MGDIIETTLAAFQPLNFYKVGGDGFWFDIKATNKVYVGLAKKSKKRCQYWFEISNPGSIRILVASVVRKSKVGLQFTLTQMNYSRFWIAWDSKNMWAGIGSSKEAVILCPISSQINYITFCIREYNQSCSIKFEVPPLCIRAPPVLREPKIIAGELQWESCDVQLPDEAVIGGHIDGETVYVVRAHHNQSLTPGVFVPSKGLAFIPWGGNDNPTENFEALCGFNLIWKPATADRVPADAFIAGYSEDRHEPLYIGRALYHNSKIPGKVQLSHKACYIAYQGNEVAVNNFEVLTVPGLNGCCANEFIEPMLNFGEYNNYHDDTSEDEEADNDVVAF